MAVPTIVALESVLERAEDLKRECSKGRLRTEELHELLSELDRRCVAWGYASRHEVR